MPQSISTTGKLRSLLLKTLNDVQDGSLDPQKASAIVKIAAQINMSLLTEAQIARLSLVDGKPRFALGDLPLERDTTAPTIEHEPEGSPVVSSKAAHDLAAAAVSMRTGERKIIDRRPTGPVSFGDPEPGRSALDQRRREAGAA